MLHSISLSLTLAAFWWLNSGFTTPLMLFLAAIAIGLVLYVAHRMDVVDHESQPIHLSLRLPGYMLWLTKEVILSNIAVIKHIIQGNESISPLMTTVPLSQKTDLGKVIYASSITLTPGTVSVDLEDDKILVHALHRDSVDELLAGEMDRRATQLES